MRAVLCPLILLALIASDAHADSDGYYCAAPGFIAVQYRSFNTKGLAGEHVLKILRYDEALGPRWTGEVVMEDFQPWALTCSSSGVVLVGGGGREKGRITYRVSVDSTGAPRIESRTVESDLTFVGVVREREPANLGNWARPGVTRLPAAGGTHTFQLRVTLTSVRQQPSGMAHHRKTFLDELDASGRTVRSMLVHEGTSYESGGGG